MPMLRPKGGGTIPEFAASCRHTTERCNSQERLLRGRKPNWLYKDFSPAAAPSAGGLSSPVSLARLRNGFGSHCWRCGAWALDLKESSSRSVVDQPFTIRPLSWRLHRTPRYSWPGALIGVVFGGFWSMSAATVMRSVPEDQVPRALGVINGGNALPMMIAHQWAGSSANPSAGEAPSSALPRRPS